MLTICKCNTIIYYFIRDISVSNKDINKSIDHIQPLLITNPVEVLHDIIDRIIPTLEVNVDNKMYSIQIK